MKQIGLLFYAVMISVMITIGHAVPDDPLIVFIEDLSFLEGEWEGQLEYLDYRDDGTKVKLQANLLITKKTDPEDYKQFLHIQSTFKEPNGSKMNGEGEIKIIDGTKVLFEGEWLVSEKQINKEKQSYKVVLRGEGKDNGILSDMRKTIIRNKDKLTVTKEVRRKNTEAWFVRNQYSLQRQK